MNNVFISYIVLLTGLLFIGCAKDEATTFGSISGVVKDQITAEALTGVWVTIAPGGDSSVTGTDGNFQFKDLDAADYTISYTKEGYASDSKKVTVSPGMNRDASVTLEPIVPVLAVTPQKLVFGNELTTLAFDITNTGKGSLQWSIAEEISWLTCQPDKGETINESSSVVVKVSRDGLERGHYSETIVISSNGGSLTIPVTLSVESINIFVEPDELDFGTLTSSLPLTLKNTGPGTKTYKVESSKSWLALSKTFGTMTETDYITAIVAREGLSAGKYDATITISTDGGDIIIPVKMEVAIEAKPTVTAENATDLTYNSVTFHGTMVSVGSSKVTRYGFCWSEQPNATIENNFTNLGDCSSPISFESPISNLNADTKYYFRAYAENSIGIAYSDKEISFTTSSAPDVTELMPKLANVTISNIQATSATFVSKVESAGETPVTDCGFCYSTTPNPTINNGIKVPCDPSSAEIGKNVTNLSDGTTYYIRSYAKNEAGISYSDDAIFTTLAITVPKLSNVVVENVGRTTAYASATIAGTGNASITECGFCWATNPYPTIYDNKVPCEVGNSFKTKLQDLPLLTTIYVRAYAINSKGTGYSADVSFTTSDTDVDIWDGVSVATKFGGGMGTESDPIIINSADQLKLLADNVNNGISYSGIYFKLIVSVNLANYTWIPIGGNGTVFSGNFDGNNNYIYGINIKEREKTGFFGSINNATIRNTKLSGKVKSDNKAYVGLLCGYAYENVLFDNIETSGEVIGSRSVGGVCGYLEQGTIRNSANKCKVSGNSYIGGLIGGKYGYNVGGRETICNCINYGRIEGKTDVGGISGACERDVISNCCNHSDVVTGSGIQANTYYGTDAENCFWLNNIVANMGVELGFGDSYDVTQKNCGFYVPSIQSCIIHQLNGADLIEELNDWVSSNSGTVVYKRWRYETIDGYACPVLE